jgi:hypothetical protein
MGNCGCTYLMDVWPACFEYPAHYRGNITRTYDRNLHIFELMKMKLAQRLLIGYYKTKLKTIALVSPRKAAEEAFDIVLHAIFRQQSPKKRRRPLFHKAEKLSFEMDGLTIRGFRLAARASQRQKDPDRSWVQQLFLQV